MFSPVYNQVERASAQEKRNEGNRDVEELGLSTDTIDEACAAQLNGQACTSGEREARNSQSPKSWEACVELPTWSCRQRPSRHFPEQKMTPGGEMLLERTHKLWKSLSPCRLLREG